MDDEELTRLAIEELVREMGEVSEANVQERKINPIAKPNKRFLGRTINSILSHNKRENDRTQQNCKRKLKELDDNRKRHENRDLSLSSSTDDERVRDNDERGRDYSKTKSRKRKNDKKGRAKKKKSKSNKKHDSSSYYSSRSTSRSSIRSRKHKTSKHKKHNPKPRVNEKENEEEELENINYEPCSNVDLNLNTALWIGSYGEHQMQQLLEYNKVMADKEAAENKDVLEELQISDVDATEQQIDIASISTAVSSLHLDEDSSEASEVLQISVSSASSSSSVSTGYKIMRKKRLKKRQSPKKRESTSSSILELDSESSKASKNSKNQDLEKNEDGSGDCICIASGSSTKSDSDTKDSKSDSSSSETDSESGSTTSMPHKISYAATDTVMLVTTSDSEVEVVDIIAAKSPAQNEADVNAEVIATCNMDTASTCTEQFADEANNEPLNLTNSHLNPNDTVGIDLSTKSISINPHVELQEAEQQQIETTLETNSAPKRNSNDYSHIEFQETTCSTNSAVTIATTTTTTTIVTVGLDLSIKSLPPPSLLELQEQQRKIESVPERESGDSPNLTVPVGSYITSTPAITAPTTTSTTTSTQQTIVNETASITASLEASQATFNEETNTKPMVVRYSISSPSSTSLASMKTNNDCDLVPKEAVVCNTPEEIISDSSNVVIGSMAEGLAEMPSFSSILIQSDSSTTSTTTESESDCKQNENLSTVNIIMPVDEQIADSDIEGSEPPPS